MFQLHRPAASAPRLPADRIDPEYRRLRRQVFVGIFVGYAAYYLVRNTLALAIPDLLREYPHYSKAMLGTAMTGLSIAYGVSKFLMGSVSDRSNPRYFLPLGLLLSAAIVFASGTLKWIYSSIALVIALQTLNGWVQGMGWPPCGKSMVHWWSTKERGLTVATWNVAHNVGGARVANRLPPARRPALPPDLARAPLSAADSPPGACGPPPARRPALRRTEARGWPLERGRLARMPVRTELILRHARGGGPGSHGQGSRGDGRGALGVYSRRSDFARAER